jgi:hypothetical protein
MPIHATCRATYQYALTGFVLIIAGCGGAQSDRPKFDSQTAANEAVRLYDDNNDGNLEPAELQDSPALASALSRLDSDGNGRLTALEIAARAEKLKGLSTHIAAEVRVTKQRRPLAGATITLVPEPFLGSGYPTYQGTSDENGFVALTASPAAPGIAVGFYRVTITLPNGSTTIRGCEIADDVTGNRIQFAL